jgi:hypothetical protein
MICLSMKSPCPYAPATSSIMTWSTTKHIHEFVEIELRHVRIDTLAGMPAPRLHQALDLASVPVATLATFQPAKKRRAGADQESEVIPVPTSLRIVHSLPIPSTEDVGNEDDPRRDPVPDAP